MSKCLFYRFCVFCVIANLQIPWWWIKCLSVYPIISHISIEKNRVWRWIWLGDQLQVSLRILWLPLLYIPTEGWQNVKKWTDGWPRLTIPIPVPNDNGSHTPHSRFLTQLDVVRVSQTQGRIRCFWGSNQKVTSSVVTVCCQQGASQTSGAPHKWVVWMLVNASAAHIQPRSHNAARLGWRKPSAFQLPPC